MTWFKVDDGFWSHPKTATLSDAAVTLWVRAGSYCCQHLTDGFVKQGALRLLGDKDSAQELVDVVLWHVVEDGWEFHDWDEYQETSGVVKKRRDDARERQRKYRELQEEKRRQSQQSSQSESRVTNGVTDTETDDVTSQPPTRPDPTRPSLSTDVDKEQKTAPPAAPKSRPRKRIPSDYMPKRHVVEKIRDEFPTVNDDQLKSVHEDFVLYWQGQGKPMADWDATWLRWTRKEMDKLTHRAPLRVINGSSMATSDLRVMQAQALKHQPPSHGLELQ